MYKKAKLLISPPDSEKVIKAHAAGICSSFTCDWLKKLLANKKLEATTYEDNSRLNKMVRRQNAYEKSDAGLDNIAKAYGLSFGDNSCLMVSQFGGDEDNIGPYFAKLPAGYYYMSLMFSRSACHALGLNSHTSQFCDANYGIFDMQGQSMAQIISQCADYLEDECGSLRAVNVYPVKLR